MGAIHDDGETIAARTGEELDTVAVERYLREHLPDLPGPAAGSLQVRQFPSGASNLTYLLQLGGWEAVLRRPPFGPLPPKAHDMRREAGLLQQVHPVFPLAPQPYLFCDDLAVMAVPFYVMERKHGVVLDRRFPQGVTPDAALCRDISKAVVETLVRIHALDWRAAGLEPFGHPEGFLERQVRGWVERYHRAQTDEIAEVEPLTRWFAAHLPVSQGATLIHNDFKLNNMLLAADDLTRPVAVLDWEMATLGDPLFDLAITLSYWITPEDPPPLQAAMPTVTTTPGFLSRDEFMQMYAQESGRDLSAMDFYMTFAYFKLAVIVQQIYVRWKRGQTADPRFAGWNERVRNLMQLSAMLAGVGA